jgi:NADP-dependent aldehyde dehydrogenase
MLITGNMIIGSRSVRGQAGTLHAFDPALGRKLEPAFSAGDSEDLELACQLAEQAFDSYRNMPLEQRAGFLEAIAENILALGNELITRANQETALPTARLEGERQRTVNQLRMFAQDVRAGHWLHATITSAMPQRSPPRSDLRLQKIPLGPVAVFGASNFPLAFSVAGGDTASALAAGCPVIVKAHPAHLGTSELVGRAIQKAVLDSGLPEGVFSLLIDADTKLGAALVAHPLIQAVGFTGSRQGGLALMAIANARPQPIPVYAEMSCINPVYLMPGALAERAELLGRQFVDSLTLGVGQFCTNPGLILMLEGPDVARFEQAAAIAMQEKPAGTMLSRRISEAYQSGVKKLGDMPDVCALARGQTGGPQAGQAQGLLFTTTGAAFLDNPTMEEEVFGPSALVVVCRDRDELLQITRCLGGQLTATLQIAETDYRDSKTLLSLLERKAGRILVNGFPTGVEVCQAMVHGGPYPATSNALSTSVGSGAIERFLRPVCYQDFPPELIPLSVQGANPLGLWRLVDGQMQNS